jgi:short-subunit dehydrogenase
MVEFVFAGTAIVTGAASGIGRSLARVLADRGMALALVDRDEDGLDATIQNIRAKHPDLRITPYTVDLADRAATRELGKDLSARHSDARLLLNNAGVALSGTFEQITEGEFDWLIDVNMNAPIILVRELLPRLRANTGAHIVNVSSVFGLVAPARNIPYATSKFALRGFTEGLRAELSGSGIGVTCVHPGGIATNISRNARVGSVMTEAEARAAERERIEFDDVLTITPDAAAEAIIDGIANRRRRVLIGASAKIPDLFARLFPTRYHSVLDAVEAIAAKWSARTVRAGQ